MPIQLPLGLVGAETKREKGAIAKGKKDVAAKIAKQYADSQQRMNALNLVDQRVAARGPLPGPLKLPPQANMLTSVAMPAVAPGENDPNRDYRPMGPSPKLTQRDIAGDPAPASGMSEGVGGPEGGAPPSDRKARLEAELRKARLMEAVKQAQAPQNYQDTSAFDVLKQYGMAQTAPQGGVGKVPEGQAAAPQQYVPKPDWRADAGMHILENGKAPDPSGAQAFMANMYQSATFGQGDKIRGGVAAAMGGNYDEEVARSREWLRKSREKEPGWSFAGEAGGFLVPGAAIGKGVGLMTRGAVNGVTRMAPALNFAARTGAAAAEGAAAGAAYGYTTGAENQAIDQNQASPDLLSQQRFDSAGVNALMGGAFGGAMPAADIVTRPVRNALGGIAARAAEPFAPGAVVAHNQRIAQGAARRAFERAGIVTVDDLLKRAAKYGDKPVVAGELSQGTLNNLTAIVRGPGTTADKAMAVLEDRVQGMPGRMLKDIADETGLKPDEVMGSIEDMVKKGRARAGNMYEAAESAPFAETANLERIVNDAPVLRSLMPKAINRVQNQAVAQIGQADQMPPLKVYDELKQLLDEQIQARIAKGEGIEDIQGVREALVRELDNISGQGATGLETPPQGASLYAQAREAGGDAPRVQAGLKAGEKALSGAKLAEDVGREVSALTGQQLTSYQIGVIRNMVKGVETGNLTPRRVRTQGFQKKLREVFGDAAAEGLIRKFGAEADLSQKGARWNPNVGSVTSQAMLGAPSAAGDAAVRTTANAARGNWGAIVLDGINSLRRRGYSENQLNEIGNIFLSSPDDAAKALFPGQKPKPGSVPPTPPPAGRVRENPPGGGSGGGNPPAVRFEDPADQLKWDRLVSQSKSLQSRFNINELRKRDQRAMRAGNLPQRFAPKTREKWMAGHLTDEEGQALDLFDSIQGELGQMQRYMQPTGSEAAQLRSMGVNKLNVQAIKDKQNGLPPGNAPSWPQLKGSPKETYASLSAQAEEAWKAGQWERANELRRQAESLPKTNAPSQGGALDMTPDGYERTSQIGNATLKYSVGTDNKTMTLDVIEVPPNARGQKEASKALDALLAQADANKLTVYLDAKPIGKGGMDEAQLRTFYAKRGFTKQAGGTGVVRSPNGPKPANDTLPKGQQTPAQDLAMARAFNREPVTAERAYDFWTLLKDETDPRKIMDVLDMNLDPAILRVPRGKAMVERAREEVLRRATSIMRKETEANKANALNRASAKLSENNRSIAREISKLRERGVPDQMIARSLGLEDGSLEYFLRWGDLKQ